MSLPALMRAGEDHCWPCGCVTFWYDFEGRHTRDPVRPTLPETSHGTALYRAACRLHQGYVRHHGLMVGQ